MLMLLSTRVPPFFCMLSDLHMSSLQWDYAYLAQRVTSH